jgi:hypothetical protein
MIDFADYCCEMSILFFLSRGLIEVVHFVRQPRQFEHGTLRSHFTCSVKLMCLGKSGLNRLLTFRFLQLSHLLPSEARDTGTYTYLPREREDALLLSRSFHCDGISGVLAVQLRPILHGRAKNIYFTCSKLGFR